MPIASCHCGPVRIGVPGPPAYLNECQCSICRRYGAQWGYDQLGEVRLPQAGATDFGCVTHWIAADTRDTRMAVNGRLLAPLDVVDVPIRKSAGRAS